MNIPHLIIGGGLAGITVAAALLKKKADFLLLESSSRLGGKIETKITEEACFEFGPNSFLNQPEEIFQLLDMLDMGGDVLEPSPAAKKRYIIRKGKIVRLPVKPQEILTTKALSFPGRLRFLRETVYVSKKKSEDESIRDFFARHFGSEVADYFADPFVSGVYAGDASKLSLKESFPLMAEAESRSSSLIRYLISQRKTEKVAPQSYQLKHGLESIFHQAAKKIGKKKIRLQESVKKIIPEGGGVKVISEKREYNAENAYLTSPAYISAEILKKHFPDLSEVLSSIDYAPVISAHLRVPKNEKYPFDGFGILLPSVEKRRILGVLWNSSTFPSLFPDKSHHYITVFAGGAKNRDIVQENELIIQEVICKEVQALFKLKVFPEFLRMRRHPQAIPQYGLGYGKILEAIRSELSKYTHLKLAGNYIGGISMPNTVASAMRVIE